MTLANLIIRSFTQNINNISNNNRIKVCLISGSVSGLLSYCESSIGGNTTHNKLLDELFTAHDHRSPCYDKANLPKETKDLIRLGFFYLDSDCHYIELNRGLIVLIDHLSCVSEKNKALRKAQINNNKPLTTNAK